MKKFFMVCRKNSLLTAGGLMLVILILIMIFGPSLCVNNPTKADYSQKLIPPCAQYPLGTDGLGRSVAARLVYAVRISMHIALTVLAFSCAIGCGIGIAAGYFGGAVDHILMRIVEIVLAFPGVILALAILGRLGGGVSNQIIALSLIRWPKFARLTRTEILLVRQTEYFEVARAMGNGHIRMIFRYILPNISSRIIVTAAMSIGPIVLASASLSFLGVGAQPPTPELGLMINEGRDFIRSAGYISLFPGLATALIALCFNLLGDGLNDLLNTKLREKVRAD